MTPHDETYCHGRKASIQTSKTKYPNPQSAVRLPPNNIPLWKRRYTTVVAARTTEELGLILLWIHTASGYASFIHLVHVRDKMYCHVQCRTTGLPCSVLHVCFTGIELHYMYTCFLQ